MDAIRSILVEAQRETYHAHDAHIQILSLNKLVPVAAVQKLIEERDFVFNEFQKRIDRLTVNA